MTQNGPPLVSVITAAYNRGNVLQYAISSVIRQQCEDWELIVVDDASTDDTAVVVGSISDPRIRYIRSEKNSGDQSEPNNEGFRQARGRYIAYLNQDDLWFPDHLTRSLQAIQSTGADWVFSLSIAVYASDDIQLLGVVPGGRYDPRYRGDIVGSTWLHKREALNDIGGWRPHHEIVLPPSQDLLVRAWKAGKNLRMVPAATVLIFPTSAKSRKNCYIDRISQEQAGYYQRMLIEPDLREQDLLKYAVARESRILGDNFRVTQALRRLLSVMAKRVLLLCGITPVYMGYFIRYRKKGGFVEAVRKNRGLPPYPGKKTSGI